MNITFFRSTYSPVTTTTRVTTTEYYFEDSYTHTINDIPYTNNSINDYCTNRHPLTRTQRYLHACTTPPTDNCTNKFEVWNACQCRDNLTYNTISGIFFTNRTSSTDDSTDFSDFDNATIVNGMFYSCLYFYLFLL